MKLSSSKIFSGADIRYWLRFVANGLLLFGLFIGFYKGLRQIPEVDEWYVDSLNSYATFLLVVSDFFVELFGFEAVIYGKTIRIVDELLAQGVYLDRGCMGRNVMLGYAGLIAMFPGGFKHKLWYIPAGLVILVFVNILRISGLAIIAYCCPEYSDINHHFVFKIAAWGVIFLLWVIWFKRFSNTKKTSPNTQKKQKSE